MLGYRGMKEYELGFDGFRWPASALLGGEEGKGFKQLMATFESARIQTAARGVGVAQAALERRCATRTSASSSAQPIFEFPRVARKIGRMVVAHHGRAAAHLLRGAHQGHRQALRSRGRHGQAARDPRGVGGGRRVRADPRRQRLRRGVHRLSRLLVDARVLSIFEGANEIQAHVIARRLLE